MARMVENGGDLSLRDLPLKTTARMRAALMMGVNSRPTMTCLSKWRLFFSAI